MAQFSRPDSDIAANGWLPSTGSDLYAMLDEVTASDADYIYLPGDSVSPQSELGMSNITDPGVNTGHIFRFRAKKSAAAGHVRRFFAYVLQAPTVIAKLQDFELTENWVDYVIEVASVDAANITDYSTLKMVFSGVVGDQSDDQERDSLVSFAEFEVPNAGSGSSNMKRPHINGSAVNYGLVQ